MVTKRTELDVYKRAFAAAMQLFELSKKFPKEETYSLTDQLRRTSRSVCANVAEAWRKRRYEAHFKSKLSDSEAEAAESQVWIQFAVECGYLDKEVATPIYVEYDQTIAMLVGMIRDAEKWVLKQGVGVRVVELRRKDK